MVGRLVASFMFVFESSHFVIHKVHSLAPIVFLSDCLSGVWSVVINQQQQMYVLHCNCLTGKGSKKTTHIYMHAHTHARTHRLKKHPDTADTPYFMF